MGKILCRIMTVAVVIGAVVNFSAVFETSPAFNDDVRLESVQGSWRVPVSAAHYDQAEYLQLLGHSYLSDFGLTYDASGALVPMEAEVIEGHMRTAVDLLETSLRLDPANAATWAYLAQAHGRLNEFDAMREALARSWTLAPHNRYLATLRFRLAAQLHYISEETPDAIAALSDQELDALRRDTSILHAQPSRDVDALFPPSLATRAFLDSFKSPPESS